MTGSTLAGQYADALEDYLEHRGEDALAAAYDVGRHALVQGRGVLDMVAAHREALVAILHRNAGREIACVEAADEFLREALSPFEMAFRGYVEANTELHRMNEVLLREREAVVAANKELETFSYSVSHDLRAPLRALSGFSRLIEEDDTGHLKPEDRAHLSRIRQAAARMNQLIEDLLALSRVARAELVRANVDLSALAQRVVERLRSADPSRDVSIVVESPLHADGDAGLLLIVLENLLGNAWKFTSKRPRAKIEVGSIHEPAGAPVFYVRDDGAGFDPKKAQRLFGPFQRLHSANDFEGTGIGLATVQRIVQRHGGRVWAESSPDHGATFYFTLGQSTAA